MMCRDPALVLQEKLLDLEHNPDDCMWWTHEIGSNWRTQPFREPAITGGKSQRARFVEAD
jgi:hypothetical protein